ncbi:hypothetical protein UFOVP1393_26 [uncultured Caudovirales phage]|uniref:Uncharacterized protein n=1 Tax=uncultured Caudovirales phage TaxID=2100421 RepID=A0A6J5S6G8_9CAUD|nr:hypothetical protein UFOVP1393_26 [uncultured Caudovirales phage]
MQTKEENLQMKLEARDLEIVALKDALFMRNQMIQRLDKDINKLDKENKTLIEIADSATARLNDSSDFNIKLHVKNRELRNEIERECKNFGEFIGHNFSTTNHAERWECDNTHELYDIEELYAKYVQHTQAGRV